MNNNGNGYDRTTMGMDASHPLPRVLHCLSKTGRGAGRVQSGRRPAAAPSMPARTCSCRRRLPHKAKGVKQGR